LIPLLEEIDHLLAEEQWKSVPDKLDLLARFKWRLLARSPDFWKRSFQDILAHPEWIPDRKKGVLLLDEGEVYLRENQIEELKGVTQKLWKLIPQSNAQQRSDIR
jgi:hypothetical protein